MLEYDNWIDDDAEDNEPTTWIALSDLMTGLMTIFLAISIAILVNQSQQQIAIVRDVSESLKDKGIDATPDPKTGDINIPTDFAFNFGQAQLTSEGQVFLNKFIPVYAEAIFELTPEKQDMITRLVVEGHTDTIGDYAHNMALSTARANAVLLYIDQMPAFDNKQALLKKLTAVGRGENDATALDNIEDANERKVVFRFNFVQPTYQADKPNTGDSDIDRTAINSANASTNAAP